MKTHKGNIIWAAQEQTHKGNIICTATHRSVCKASVIRNSMFLHVFVNTKRSIGLTFTKSSAGPNEVNGHPTSLSLQSLSEEFVKQEPISPAKSTHLLRWKPGTTVVGEDVPPQFSMTCTAGTMSGKRPFRPILMRSARLLSAPWAQQLPQSTTRQFTAHMQHIDCVRTVGNMLVEKLGQIVRSVDIAPVPFQRGIRHRGKRTN